MQDPNQSPDSSPKSAPALSNQDSIQQFQPIAENNEEIEEDAANEFDDYGYLDDSQDPPSSVELSFRLVDEKERRQFYPSNSIFGFRSPSQYQELMLHSNFHAKVMNALDSELRFNE